MFNKPEKWKTAKKIIINAVEGFGKTTLGAYAPNPVILMTQGEKGYLTLSQGGRVPQVDCLVSSDWTTTMKAVKAASEYDTIVIDTLDSFEKQLFSFITMTKFQGNHEAFLSYGKGVEIALMEFTKFLNELEASNRTVILLSHAKVKEFKNPLTADNYDRYIADCNEKVWRMSARWADAVLFGTFESFVSKEKHDKAKGVGGQDRVIYTEHRDTHDAKNRFGMPYEIRIPNDYKKVYETIFKEIK